MPGGNEFNTEFILAFLSAFNYEFSIPDHCGFVNRDMSKSVSRGWVRNPSAVTAA
jgi:hypothetical protein